MKSFPRIIYTLVAVVAGLTIGTLLFIPFNVNPIAAYQTMFGEAFLSRQGIGTTLTKATPLIFVGLGTLVAWKSGFYYLGFQGTLYLGATGATLVALGARDGHILAGIPSPLLMVISLLAAFAFGGLWALIVGVLKVSKGGNDVLLSLMFNYVAVYLVNYLVTRPLRAEGSLPQTERFPDRATLPRLLGETNDLHFGFVVALLAAGVVWYVMRFTSIGYQFTSFGLNERASRYAGINAKRVTLVAAFTAGGLGALAGWSQVLGVQYRLLDGLDQVTGFEGIVTALLGGLNAIGAVFAAILYGGLVYGAQVMQRRIDIPSSVASMIQGVIVLLVLTGPIWGHFVARWRRRNKSNGVSEGIAVQ